MHQCGLVLAVYLVLLMIFTVAFVKNTSGKMLTALVVLVLGSTCLAAYSLYYIHRNVLRPIQQIRGALISFSKTKDTDHLIEDMNRLRSLNEVGRFAGEVADMTDQVKNYVLAKNKENEEKARAATELQLAGVIQASMLPDTFPDPDEEKRFDLFASMHPAREVGGDLYDFFMIGKEHLVLVIADASEKGIPAAFFMTETKILIKEKTLTGKSPSEIMKEVNEELLEHNKAQQFITVWFMLINLTTGKALEINAGHTKPALCRAGGEFELVRNKHSMVMGMMKNMKYREIEWQLNSGDKIFVYTDGISEAMNEKDELFGEERMIEALNEVKDKNQKEILLHMENKVVEYEGTAQQFDDMTMMGFTFRGGEQAQG